MPGDNPGFPPTSGRVLRSCNERFSRADRGPIILKMTTHRQPEDQSFPSGGPRRSEHAVAPSDVAQAGPLAVRGVEALAHELGNMLDGSLRMLGLALRTLDRANSQHADHADQNLNEAHRQIQTASFALQRMADLVHAAMQGATLPLGSTGLSNTRPVTLGEAIEHSVHVITPSAEQRGTKIHTEVSPDVASQPAGPLYSVLLNGLRNALESIAQAGTTSGSATGGTIEISATCEAPPPGHRVQWICITITDDGLGPPKGPNAHRVFEHGFTTKPGGHGLGLALSRSIVRDLHGTIQLMPRLSGDTSRRGAVLRIAIPAITGEPWNEKTRGAGSSGASAEPGGDR